MSGSDYSGGGASFTDVDACDKLIINTRLSSPREAVISKLKVGYLLDVVLDESGQYLSVVLHFKDEVAGGIATPQTAVLINCMREGTTYFGEVMVVNDGDIKIRIKPAGPESL